jgi:hypothetical protein
MTSLKPRLSRLDADIAKQRRAHAVLNAKLFAIEAVKEGAELEIAHLGQIKQIVRRELARLRKQQYRARLGR